MQTLVQLVHAAVANDNDA